MRDLLSLFNQLILVYLGACLFHFPFLEAEEAQKKPDKEVINGINVRKLNDFIEKLKKNPAAGYVTFSSITEGQGGTKSMTIFTGYEIEGMARKERKVKLRGEDLPEKGGGDLVPIDVEEMMTAVGASVIAVTSLKAAVMGIELSKIELSLESDINLMGTLELDIHKRPGVADFRVKMTIAGNADEDTLRRIAIAGWQFSPVADTVRNGVSTAEFPKVLIRSGKLSFLPRIGKPESKTNNPDWLNGIDIKKLKNFIDLVKKDPKEGLITFFSNTKWEEGTKSLTTITGYRLGGETNTKRKFTIPGEDIAELGGSDVELGPIERMMHAVGACITARTNEGGSLAGLEISKIQVALESDIDLHGLFELDPNIRPGLLNLRVTINIQGNANDDALKKAAIGGYEMSSVADTVRNGVTTVIPLIVIVESAKQ